MNEHKNESQAVSELLTTVKNINSDIGEKVHLKYYMLSRTDRRTDIRMTNLIRLNSSPTVYILDRNKRTDNIFKRNKRTDNIFWDYCFDLKILQLTLFKQHLNLQASGHF